MRHAPLRDDEPIPCRCNADGEIEVLVYPEPPAEPQPWPKSSRTIAREKAKAAEAEQLAAEAAKLRAQVHRSLRPPSGRLWSVHPDALLLIGPAGGVPVSAAAVSVLEPLAAGGRHVPQERDRIALAGLAGRLAVVGLRVDRRKTGWRIAKAKANASHLTA